MDNLYEIAKNNLSADNEHFDAFEYIKTIKGVGYKLEEKR